MKVILSRKGFDSQYGKMPSPILPDGTLLSLPIPSKIDLETKFTDICHEGQSYYDIIRTLTPHTAIKEKYGCHLDPDIRAAARLREAGWKPVFGQENTALKHLQNQGVGTGDLFLFFGWFKQTEYVNGQLVYKKGAPDLHVIYGYFQVGDMITSPVDVPAWLHDHPHVKAEKWVNPNVIFTAPPTLSLCSGLPGAGCLTFNDKLVLTKSGCSRSTWNLPDFFRKIPISYNANSWKTDCFVAAAKGQEFVFEANDSAIEWVKDIISTSYLSKNSQCMNQLKNENKYYDNGVNGKPIMELNIGVFRVENRRGQGGYEFHPLSQAVYEKFIAKSQMEYKEEKTSKRWFEQIFSKSKQPPVLEAVFVISNNPFSHEEKGKWQAKYPSLYVDRIFIHPSLNRESSAIYNVVYDFIAISTVEKGITEEPTKMARIKIDKTSPLVEVFQEDEDYKLVGEYDNWYFFEIDVEHFE